LDKIKTFHTIKGNRHSIGVKHINKKGTYKSRLQCNTCDHLGYVLEGINGTYKASTCDRDGVTWRERNGSTARVCKHHKGVDNPEIKIQPQSPAQVASQAH